MKTFGWSKADPETFEPLELERDVKFGKPLHLGDVFNLVDAFDATGHYKKGRQGKPPLFEGSLFKAIKDFQNDEGLEPDSWMTPGGPTLQRLNEILPQKLEKPWRGAKVKAPLYEPFADLNTPAAEPRAPSTDVGDRAIAEIMPQRPERVALPRSSPADRRLATTQVPRPARISDRYDPVDPRGVIRPGSNSFGEAQNLVALAPLVPAIVGGARALAPLVRRYGPAAIGYARRLLFGNPPPAAPPAQIPDLTNAPTERAPPTSEAIAPAAPAASPRLITPAGEFPLRPLTRPIPGIPAEEIDDWAEIVLDPTAPPVETLFPRTATSGAGRRGDEDTRAHLDRLERAIREGCGGSPEGIEHISGGSLSERFMPPQDIEGRPILGRGQRGGTYADLVFEIGPYCGHPPQRRRLYINTVDVLRRSVMLTRRELDSGYRILLNKRRHDLFLVWPKEDLDDFDQEEFCRIVRAILDELRQGCDYDPDLSQHIRSRHFGDALRRKMMDRMPRS